MDTINGQETNQKTTYSLAFHNDQSIVFKKERIFAFVMPFLNVFYEIHGIFAKKSIEKIFSVEKYRDRCYFF